MITIDVPEGKTLTITGPGQVILKNQTPDQLDMTDLEVIPQYSSVIPETIAEQQKK